MQSFTNIPASTLISASLALLLDNTRTVLSNSEGVGFPTVDLVQGMWCFRSDQLKVYFLKDFAGPGVTDNPNWVEIIDFASLPAKLSDLAAHTAIANPHNTTAADLAFANATTGLVATTVQAALAELAPLMTHDHTGVYEPIDANILRLNVSQTLTAGFPTGIKDHGTVSTGTVTPLLTEPWLKTLTVSGNIIIAAPTTNGGCEFHLKLSGTGHAVDTTAYSKVIGDTIDTTVATNEYWISIRKAGAKSLMVITNVTGV
jgi:hypothetical protein